jgi:hypothetical protein
MRIIFNSSFNMNYNLSELNSTVIDIYVNSHNESATELEERLGNNTLLLNLTWKASKRLKDELHIKIDFLNATSISSLIK